MNHQKTLKSLRIIHLIVCLSVIVAYSILGNFNLVINFEIPEIGSSIVIYTAILLGAILLSNLIFKVLLNAARKVSNEDKKLQHYIQAFIYRLSILEGAALLIIIFDPSFIFIGFIIIIYMITLVPSEYKLKRHLKIN